ncbi:hypothetical protein FRB96_006807 [Tulasnella sp. 330]|nr:hypothetical protein FRB96_006807 [Tulasnella sp. 330]
MPPPSEETLRRRAQSDLASQRIGAKMLQGYAMLAEECQNPECFGVPLLRPPRPGSKDPHKECVICDNVYVEALDSRGRTILQLVETSVPTPTATTSTVVDSPQHHIASASHILPVAVNGTRSQNTSNGHAIADVKGMAKQSDALRSVPSASVQSTIGNAVLGDVLASVDKSLSALSTRLNLLSGAEPSMLNSTLLGEAATQIGILLGVRETALRQAAHSSS